MTTYYVRDAISSDPSALSHWGRQVENTLYLCYQDTFEVGEFKSDKEAIQAVEKKQTVADETATGAGAVFRVRFDFSKLPRYKEHLYKKKDYANGPRYIKVSTAPKNWGGSRPNAGRKAGTFDPAEIRKSHNIRMNDEEYAMFLELGGIEWLRSLLNEKISQRKPKSDPSPV